MKRSPNFVLGITGGIASGKSTVLAMLSEARVPVISSDELSHACLQKKHPVAKAVVRHFGKTILNANQDIDRRALGKIVFKDVTERRWLQKQIHPYVLKGLKKFIQSRTGLIAVDIPLLYEAHYEFIADKIVVVYSTPAQQAARLRKRNPLSAAEIRERISAQWPLSKKKQWADIVLDNTRTTSFLRKQVGKMLDNYLKKA